MAKVKFALKMKDGVEVRSIEELKKNFDNETIIEHFLSGKLVEWLEDRYYDDEEEKISALDKNSPHLIEKICDVLGVEYVDPEVDKAINARLNEKKKFLRQKTNDGSIIDNVAITALNQEDLAYLLDSDEPIIYLCGESFNIPIRIENKKYVGILGTPKIKIKADSWREIKDKNIIFVNVDLNDNLKEPKNIVTNEPPQNNSSPTPKINPAPPTPPKPKSLPIHELKKILIDSYPSNALWVKYKDKDYGDLWHFRTVWAFMDERFAGSAAMNSREKSIALNMICHNRYRESDLVRIGAYRADRIPSLNITEKNKDFYGFALTNDSICMKGMWLADCIIPYGNIKEVKDTIAFNDKEIIFFISKSETAHITLSSGKYDFDIATLRQLEKYLNTVKNYYSPDYDKIFLKVTSTGGLFGNLFGNSSTPWL